jgi:hypothetical protein
MPCLVWQLLWLTHPSLRHPLDMCRPLSRKHRLCTLHLLSLKLLVVRILDTRFTILLPLLWYKQAYRRPITALRLHLPLPHGHLRAGLLDRVVRPTRLRTHLLPKAAMCLLVMVHPARFRIRPLPKAAMCLLVTVHLLRELSILDTALKLLRLSMLDLLGRVMVPTTSIKDQ